MADFDEIDQQIIRNAMISQTNSEIALLIDADVHDVAQFIASLAGMEVRTRQMKVDERLKARKQKALKAPKIKKSKILSEAKRRTEELKKLKLQQSREKNNIEVARHRERQARREPAYKTKVVDYSKMFLLKIDAKTSVYVQPGEDLQAVRQKYQERIKASTPEEVVKKYNEAATRKFCRGCDKYVKKENFSGRNTRCNPCTEVARKQEAFENEFGYKIKA